MIAGVLQVCAGARYSRSSQLWNQQLGCKGHAQEARDIWHACYGIRDDRVAMYISSLLLTNSQFSETR